MDVSQTHLFFFLFYFEARGVDKARVLLIVVLKITLNCSLCTGTSRIPLSTLMLKKCQNILYPFRRLLTAVGLLFIIISPITSSLDSRSAEAFPFPNRNNKLGFLRLSPHPASAEIMSDGLGARAITHLDARPCHTLKIHSSESGLHPHLCGADPSPRSLTGGHVAAARRKRCAEG